MSQCRSCGAPILWIKTHEGKNMPCDPGLVDVQPGDRVTVVTKSGLVYRNPTQEVQGYISHFASCPDAQSWRKQ